MGRYYSTEPYYTLPDTREEPLFLECDNCGEEIELDLDCMGAASFYNIPVKYEDEPRRICEKCFYRWVKSESFIKEFADACAVKDVELIEEARERV